MSASQRACHDRYDEPSSRTAKVAARESAAAAAALRHAKHRHLLIAVILSPSPILWLLIIIIHTRHRQSIQTCFNFSPRTTPPQRGVTRKASGCDHVLAPVLVMMIAFAEDLMMSRSSTQWKERRCAAARSSPTRDDGGLTSAPSSLPSRAAAAFRSASFV